MTIYIAINREDNKVIESFGDDTLYGASMIDEYTSRSESVELRKLVIEDGNPLTDALLSITEIVR